MRDRNRDRGATTFIQLRQIFWSFFTLLGNPIYRIQKADLKIIEKTHAKRTEKEPIEIL